MKIRQVQVATQNNTSHKPHKPPPRSRYLGFTLLAMTPIALMVQAAYAQTWTGAASNDWNNSTNWNPTTVPGTSASVILNTKTPNSTFIDTGDSNTTLDLNTLTIGSGASNHGELSVQVGNSLGGGSFYLFTQALDIGTNGGNGTLTIDMGQSLGSSAWIDIANNTPVNIGTSGGTGQLNVITPGQTATAGWGQGETQIMSIMNVGSGANSSGTINITSSSTNMIGHRDPMFTIGLMSNSAFVGDNGGRGEVLVKDAMWVIDSLYGSTYTLGGIAVGNGAGSQGHVTISSGGWLSFAASYFYDPGFTQVGILVGEGGGRGTIDVVGTNANGFPSTLTSGQNLSIGHGIGSTGNLNVLSGGKVAAYDSAYEIPTHSMEVGSGGGTGSVLISGQGSILHVMGHNSMLMESATGDLYVGIGNDSTGSLTLADGGTVELGSATLKYSADGNGYYEIMGENAGNVCEWDEEARCGTNNGILYLAQDGGSTGTLNIGAAAGQGAVAPGTLYAAGTVLGAGNGNIIFNHTNPNYQFEPYLVGTGTLQVYSGTTWISNDNSQGFTSTRRNFDPSEGTIDTTQTFTDGFHGQTRIYGGALGLNHSLAIGDSTVYALGNGALIYGRDTGISVANPINLQGNAVLDLSVINALSSVQTGTIAGTGGIRKTGNGTLTLSNLNTYTGPTIVNSGTLAAGSTNVFSPTSAYIIEPLGTLDLQGFNQRVASLNNMGTVNINGRFDATLTTGSYTSNGGKLVLSSILEGNTSLIDILVADQIITGPGGATRILVNNLGGLGGKTTGNGIEIVHANNPALSPEDAFMLGDRVAAGAYEYTLYQHGLGAGAQNGNWYLRSTYDSGNDPTPVLPNYRPEIALDIAIPSLTKQTNLSLIGTYHDRLGNTDMGATGSGERSAIWGRIIGQSGSSDYSGYNRGSSSMTRFKTFEEHGPSYDYKLHGFQAGMDLHRSETESQGRHNAGLYLGFAHMDSTVGSIYNDKAGTVDMDAYTLGAYWTHQGPNGGYTDAVLQATRYSKTQTHSSASAIAYATRNSKSRITSSSINGQTFDTDSTAYAASLEAGYAIPLQSDWVFEPQAQVIYQHIRLDDGSDRYGQVQYEKLNTLDARIGARMVNHMKTATGQPLDLWLRANLWYSPDKDTETTITNRQGKYAVKFKSDLPSSSLQFGLGISGKVSKNMSLFFASDYSKLLDGNEGNSISAQIGMHALW